MFNENYSKVLFENILLKYTTAKKVKVLTGKDNKYLIQKKEKYETSKRIITRFLEYIVAKNLNKTIRCFKFMNFLSNDFEKSYQTVISSKEKLKKFKKCYLELIGKINLKREKMKNCKFLLENLKTIKSWYMKYLTLSATPKEATVRFNRDSISENDQLTYSQIEKLIQEIGKSKYSQKSKISFFFIQNLKNAQKFYLDNFEEDLNSIFLKKRNENDLRNLYDMFTLMKATNRNDEASCKKEFLSFLVRSFKQNIFRIIRGALLSYADINSMSKSSNTLKKLSHLSILSFEDIKLFFAFKQICLSLSFLCDIFNSYLHLAIKDNIFKNNKQEFANILTKKIIKIIDIFSNQISSCSCKKWTFHTIACLHIFSGVVFKSFETEDVEKLKYKMGVIIKLSGFNQFKKDLKRTKVFLSNDNFKRINMRSIKE